MRSTVGNYRTENIVTRGLVLYLDAGNPNSYYGPSNSLVWKDLSKNANNGTLVNGPTFNDGAFVFDGVDDYITNIGTTSTFSFIQNSGVFTICAWVKLNDFTNPSYFIGNNDGTTNHKGFYLGYSGSSGILWLAITYGVGGQFVISQIRTNFFTDSNWVFVSCVGNGINSQFYKDGTIFSTPSSFINFSTGESRQNLSIGRINNVNGSYWNGNISNTQVYNRALTPSEISQNFNAQRSRFGI